MSLKEADSSDLLQWSEQWVKIGWSVQAQVEDVLRDGRDAEVNKNAVALALDKLGGLNDEVDEALNDWVDANKRE